MKSKSIQDNQSLLGLPHWLKKNVEQSKTPSVKEEQCECGSPDVKHEYHNCILPECGCKTEAPEWTKHIMGEPKTEDSWICPNTKCQVRCTGYEKECPVCGKPRWTKTENTGECGCNEQLRMTCEEHYFDLPISEVKTQQGWEVRCQELERRVQDLEDRGR